MGNRIFNSAIFGLGLKRDHMEQYVKTAKRFYGYFFFIIEWDPSTDRFCLTQSKRKILLYLAKSAFFIYYCFYQMANVPLVVFDRRRKMLNVSMFINMMWVASSFVIVYFHVANWFSRHHSMGAINAFAKVYRDPALPQGHASQRIDAKIVTYVAVCFTREIMFSNLLVLAAMFLMDPTQPRYFFHLLPPSWQIHWALIPALVLESYIMAHLISTANMMWGIVLLYPMFLRDWLVGLQKLKLNMYVNWSQESKLKQRFVRSKKFPQILSSYTTARILSIWFNASYEKLFFIPFKSMLTILHSMFFFAVLKFHDSLPLPALIVYGFWAVVLFPVGGLTLNAMADVAKTSDAIIGNWRIGLSGLEKRMLRAQRPIGVKSGSIVRKTDVLQGLLLVSILSKNFLLLS